MTAPDTPVPTREEVNDGIDALVLSFLPDRTREQSLAAERALKRMLDALYTRLATLEAERDAAVHTLRVIGENYDDCLTPVPPHDCEFFTNPPKGSCDFHDAIVDAIAAARGQEEG